MVATHSRVLAVKLIYVRKIKIAKILKLHKMSQIRMQKASAHFMIGSNNDCSIIGTVVLGARTR